MRVKLTLTFDLTVELPENYDDYISIVDDIEYSFCLSRPAKLRDSVLTGYTVQDEVLRPAEGSAHPQS